MSVNVLAAMRRASSPLPVVAVVRLVLDVVAVAADPEIRPPLPEVALARLRSVPSAMTLTAVISVAGTAAGAAMYTLSPSAASVTVFDVARASLKPAATIPAAKPEPSACCRVSLLTFTSAVPVRVRRLSSPTLLLTRLSWSAWATVALRPANNAPAAPVASADTLAPLPASACVADTVRLRPVNWVLLPR